LQEQVEKPKTLKYDKWTELDFSDTDGWMVTCDWASKDKNNEYIIARNTFVIRDGKVAEVR